MTTYNHAFSIAFAVAKSNHSDPHEAWKQEKDKIISALLQRVAQLIQDKGEYRASCDTYDTYEESDLPTILELG